MKKIAFVSDALYPYNKGGKETRLYEISTRLAKKGYDVHIYCMHWWKGPEKTRKEHGVTLHAISPYYPLYVGERRSIKQGIMFGLHCFKLIKEDFDVIDVDHMPFFPLYSSKLVCLLKGKKMYATWHEVWGQEYWLEYMGWKGIISSFIEFLSFRLPDTFISVSDHTSELLSKYVSADRIKTISNGINVDEINKAKPSPVISDVIFAGRLLKHKNVDILLQSIKLLKKNTSNIRCIIVGDGPEKEKLTKLAKELNLEKNVKFINFCKNQQELFGLMKSSKVFVLPSSREGFGLVVLEANACKLPTITVNERNNAAKNLIKNNFNGYVTIKNSYTISKSIKKYLTQKKLKRKFSTFNEYLWESKINKLMVQY